MIFKNFHWNVKHSSVLGRNVFILLIDAIISALSN